MYIKQHAVSVAHADAISFRKPESNANTVADHVGKRVPDAHAVDFAYTNNDAKCNIFSFSISNFVCYVIAELDTIIVSNAILVIYAFVVTNWHSQYNWLAFANVERKYDSIPFAGIYAKRHTNV